MRPVTCPHCGTEQEVKRDNIEFFVVGMTEKFFNEYTDKERLELGTLEFTCINCQEFFKVKAADVVKPSDKSRSNKVT